MVLNDKNSKHNSRLNILFMIVDEQRFPTVYESEELKDWRKENLLTQEILSEKGMTFLKHYVGSTACSPSRTTLFTGQYPSLHGVTQTTGAAKGAFDDNVFWLDHNTVPTIGNYFKTAGYQTFWKGKWHLSDEDILIPSSHHALLSYNDKGVTDPKNKNIYFNANRLKDFGFDGWVGPEPHGADPRNSGSSAAIGLAGRDEIYTAEVVDLIQSLEISENNQPWFIVASLVNPHDITLFGALSRVKPTYNFQIDSSVPNIQPAPSYDENLRTKPRAQKSYRDVYQKAFQPTIDSNYYRKLYYSLQKRVDGEHFKIYTALANSRFYENTIIVYTSDHGTLLGAHGGLFQKWHNAYEEALHVPLIIHSPNLFSEAKTTDVLTSHVDILPTLLTLAKIDVEQVQATLATTHSEVHPFVGKDLSPLILEKGDFQYDTETIYFMTDDEVSKGLNQTTIQGEPYSSVIQPNHLETIITYLPTGKMGEAEQWKFTRYFDNPQFWSEPNEQDIETNNLSTKDVSEKKEVIINLQTIKTVPVEEEYELYNLTQDPMETRNLSYPDYQTSETRRIQNQLTKLLKAQRKQKRLSPND